MVVKKRGTVKRASPKPRRKPSAIKVYRPTGTPLSRSAAEYHVRAGAKSLGRKGGAILHVAPKKYVPIARKNSA